MQSWGSVAVDPRRPTDSYPRASAVTGLLANALGWRHRDAERITRLQDSLDYAVREDRQPARMWDYQTADLSKLSGWTRWGPEKPGGGSAAGTHILNKEYLADALFTVALGLTDAAPVGLEDVERALLHPARPLFLGRKSCIPSGPIFVGRVEAPSARAALQAMPLVAVPPPSDEGLRVWFDAAGEEHDGSTREVWDRRNYVTGRFDRVRHIDESRMQVPDEETAHE